jgi:hypothetical protein
MVQINSHGHGNVSASVNKILPLFRKLLFHFKNRQVLLTQPVLQWRFRAPIVLRCGH